MTYNVKGDLSVSGNISVSGKNVITQSNGEYVDENGNLNFDSSSVSFVGNINEIIIFNGTEYGTEKIIDSARIVNSDLELEDEKNYSTVGLIYDISLNQTWTYSGSWVSSEGITLSNGVIYRNSRTNKLFFNDPDLGSIQFVGTQTIGTGYAQIPSMDDFDYNFSTNGYQTLPTGMILQWGEILTSDGTGTLILEKPFSTILLGAFCIDASTSSWATSVCIKSDVDMSQSDLTKIVIRNVTLSSVSSLSVATSTGNTSVKILAWGF